MIQPKYNSLKSFDKMTCGSFYSVTSNDLYIIGTHAALYHLCIIKASGLQDSPIPNILDCTVYDHLDDHREYIVIHP